MPTKKTRDQLRAEFMEQVRRVGAPATSMVMVSSVAPAVDQEVEQATRHAFPLHNQPERTQALVVLVQKLKSLTKSVSTDLEKCG